MAATDVLSLSDAKRALGVGAGSIDKDAVVAAYVTAVSERLDRACGPIVRRAVTEYLDGGTWAVRTATAPIFSFTSVTEWSGESSSVLTLETNAAAGTYLAESFAVNDPAGLYSGRLVRRSGRANVGWKLGSRNVVVVASAGRYATTAAAANSRFAQAARILLKHLWSAETLNVGQVDGFDTPFPSFPRTMPMVIRQLLSADWREALVVG